MGRVYGYVRISSRDQNEARQMAAMREAGVSDRDIYLDKRSGADFERQGYRQLLRRLRAGDTLIVKSIDRLGRNYDEILEQWRIITWKSARPSLCWICRCWIPGRTVI